MRLHLRLLLLAAVLSTSACRTTRKIVGPDGTTQYIVTCGAESGWDSCYRRARHVCPTGYDTLSKDARSEHNSLRIACSAQPRSANREYAEHVRKEDEQALEESDGTSEEESDGTSWHARVERIVREIDVRHQEDDYSKTRANPRAPELGSTPLESQALCTRQGGQSIGNVTSGSPTQYTCYVGRVQVYVALVEAGAQTISAVKVFYEGGEIESMRAELEGRVGPAERVEIDQGYRVWIWEKTTPQVDLRSYDAGVAKTTRIPEQEFSRRGNRAAVGNSKKRPAR